MNRGKVYAEGSPSEIFALDKELVQLGLDIPFTQKLVKGLRNNGYDIPRILHENELVDYLWKYRQKI